MSRSLPGPPRNFETVTIIGSREAMTCLIGGSMSISSGAGDLQPEREVRLDVQLVVEREDEAGRRVEDRHGPVHQLLEQIVLGPQRVQRAADVVERLELEELAAELELAGSGHRMDADAGRCDCAIASGGLASRTPTYFPSAFRHSPSRKSPFQAS